MLAARVMMILMMFPLIAGAAAAGVARTLAVGAEIDVLAAMTELIVLGELRREGNEPRVHWV